MALVTVFYPVMILITLLVAARDARRNGVCPFRRLPREDGFPDS